MELFSATFLVIFGIVAFVATILVSIAFRKVVETNVVHIVQSRKKTTSYGTGQVAGNVYYNWPSFLPLIGVTRIILPVSNFDLSLKDYEAYDKDRVPFKVDVTAFFRIKETSIAAQRVKSTTELEEQLHLIVQGAVRKVLASDCIDSIMLERAKFGQQFTAEVCEQLREWGVESVKSMELMDIRDGHDSHVISNIMAKKTSHIEMESRTEVAKNMKLAQTAEIEAQQTVDIRQQEAEQAVGQRTAEKDQKVGIARQVSQQEVKAQEAITKEREMDVLKVAQVRQADITREAAVVTAEQGRQTTVIGAEAALEATKRHAEGVRVDGVAKADAEKAMQLAPVMAQIELAKEIGTNPGYQSYLVSLKGVEAYTAVGSKQAEALARADIKVIANAGSAVTGVDNAMELFSSKGGLAMGSMLEALSNTPAGKTLLDSVKLRLVPTTTDKGIDVAK